MKKLLLGLAFVTLALGGGSPSANALDSCTVSGTGPDSVNTCESKADFTCKVETDNKFTITNKNGQEVASGTAAVVDNTEGGTATSGSATNSNGTKIDVAIDNSGACVIAAVTPPTPVTPTPVTPSVVTPSGGRGEVIAPVPAPAGRGAVAALPNTGAESAIAIVTGLITLLGATILGSRFAVSTYDNIKS